MATCKTCQAPISEEEELCETCKAPAVSEDSTPEASAE